MEQQFKHNPAVRAYLRDKQRKYRANQKVREAQAGQREASLTPTTPREVANARNIEL